MTTMDFEEYLQEVLLEIDKDNGFVEAPKRINTFENSGVLTSNKGLVVKMKDGSEFQVTIVKSE
jgi:hypothetical protein